VGFQLQFTYGESKLQLATHIRRNDENCEALPTCYDHEGLETMDPSLLGRRRRPHPRTWYSVVRIPFPIRSIPSLAFRAWLTPPPLGSAAAQLDQESLTGLSQSQFGGVPGYEIGAGPLVIAVHGWGGRAGQMASVARRLADEGFHVVIPELPGHAGGARTDIKESAGALRSLIDEIGEPEMVVAHSFAAMVLRLVYPESGPPKVVMVAPALSVEQALGVFGRRLRLFPWTQRGLRRRLRSWDPSLWPRVSQILPAQLEGTDILIVHDPRDRETPFAGSAELAAIRPDTSIVPLEGAGHSRILSNPETLDHVASFVTGDRVSNESSAV